MTLTDNKAVGKRVHRAAGHPMQDADVVDLQLGVGDGGPGPRHDPVNTQAHRVAVVAVQLQALNVTLLRQPHEDGAPSAC